MFGIKLVYDVHDVSEETLRGKFADAGLAFQVFAKPIRWLERISIAWSDLVIATNLSISRRVAALSPASASWSCATAIRWSTAGSKTSPRRPAPA